MFTFFFINSKHILRTKLIQRIKLIFYQYTGRHTKTETKNTKDKQFIKSFQSL